MDKNDVKILVRALWPTFAMGGVICIALVCTFFGALGYFS